MVGKALCIIVLFWLLICNGGNNDTNGDSNTLAMSEGVSNDDAIKAVNESDTIVDNNASTKTDESDAVSNNVTGNDDDGDSVKSKKIALDGESTNKDDGKAMDGGSDTNVDTNVDVDENKDDDKNNDVESDTSDKDGKVVSKSVDTKLNKDGNNTSNVEANVETDDGDSATNSNKDTEAEETPKDDDTKLDAKTDDKIVIDNETDKTKDIDSETKITTNKDDNTTKTDPDSGIVTGATKNDKNDTHSGIETTKKPDKHGATDGDTIVNTSDADKDTTDDETDKKTDVDDETDKDTDDKADAKTEDDSDTEKKNIDNDDDKDKETDKPTDDDDNTQKETNKATKDDTNEETNKDTDDENGKDTDKETDKDTDEETGKDTDDNADKDTNTSDTIDNDAEKGTELPTPSPTMTEIIWNIKYDTKKIHSSKDKNLVQHSIIFKDLTINDNDIECKSITIIMTTIVSTKAVQTNPCDLIDNFKFDLLPNIDYVFAVTPTILKAGNEIELTPETIKTKVAVKSFSSMELMIVISNDYFESLLKKHDLSMSNFEPKLFTDMLRKVKQFQISSQLINVSVEQNKKLSKYTVIRIIAANSKSSHVSQMFLENIRDLKNQDLVPDSLISGIIKNSQVMQIGTFDLGAKSSTGIYDFDDEDRNPIAHWIVLFVITICCLTLCYKRPDTVRKVLTSAMNKFGNKNKNINHTYNLINREFNIDEFDEELGDKTGVQLFKKVLNDLRIPGFAQQGYINALKTNYLTTVEQLQQLDNTEWKKLSFPRSIELEFKKQLNSTKNMDKTPRNKGNSSENTFADDSFDDF